MRMGYRHPQCIFYILARQIWFLDADIRIIWLKCIYVFVYRCLCLFIGVYEYYLMGKFSCILFCLFCYWSLPLLWSFLILHHYYYHLQLLSFIIISTIVIIVSIVYIIIINIVSIVCIFITNLHSIISLILPAHSMSLSVIYFMLSI